MVVIKKFADTVDEKIKDASENHVGDLIEALVNGYSEFSDDLSEDEYLEFIKRNLKGTEQIILDSVKDQL